MHTLTNTENIFDINETEFSEKVLELSLTKLVLVDFWAPWCGPCKQLTPLLEKIVNKSSGLVKLIKINIDENQQIATQLNIQSIPAVFAFKDKQPIDAFQGIIPENKIVEFVEKNLGNKISKDYSEFYKTIKSLFEEKKYEEVITSLEEFIINNPEEFLCFALYIDCLTELEQYQNAYDFYKNLSDEKKKNELINSSFKKLEIKNKNSKGPLLSELEDRFKKSPADPNLICELADKYFSENFLDKAFILLLDNYFLNKEIIKKKILEFFNALGNNHEKTIEYRRKLSSIIFS